MKTQEEINAAWIQKAWSNTAGCEIEFFAPPTRQVPGLRKPYQYEVSAAEGKKLVSDINSMFKDPGVDSLAQCLLVDSKPTKYGIRFNVFILAYAHGLVHNPGEPDKGCSPQQWATLTGWVYSRLKETLGDWAPLYIESWSNTQKFQARFETYIKYREL